MIRVNIRTDYPASNRLLYVIEFLNKHPVIRSKIKFISNSTEGVDRTIYYGSSKDKLYDYCIKPQSLFFKRAPRDKRRQLHANLYKYNDTLLYSVEEQILPEREFVQNDDVSFDIFEMIFFHISRFEEFTLKQTDYLKDKLIFEQQLFSVKNGLEKIPLVDNLLYVFYELLAQQRPQRISYKSLSHDIDHIQLFRGKLDIVKKTGGIFYHRKGMSAMRVLFQAYKEFVKFNRDPYNNFEWLMKTRADSKTVYFLVGGNHQWDSVYSLDHSNFKSAISLARTNGYTIGIHPSYLSWANTELIRQQKSKLESKIGQEINVSRQHFLNFDISVTPECLLAAGIVRDSSLGYTRYTGYRCGTAFPYHLYDFNKESTSELIEEPLVFMDMAWYYESLRNDNWQINHDQFNGCFNFHNSFFFQAEQSDIAIKESYLRTFGL